MKLSLIVAGLASVALGKKIDGYCIEHRGLNLEGAVDKEVAKDCWKADKNCNFKKASAACEKAGEACAGVTCYKVKKDKECVVYANATLLEDTSESKYGVATWLKADEECGTENRIALDAKRARKKEDSFGMAEMMIVNGMANGELDDMTAMMMGADMGDIMKMKMMNGNDQMDRSTMAMMMGAGMEGVMMMDMIDFEEMDPTMMAMMGGGDVAEMMLMQEMMGKKEETEAPAKVTINGLNCVGGRTRVITTTTGPKVVCASVAGTTIASSTVVSSSGTRCMYGSRVVTTTDGKAVTVCNPRVITTTTTGTTTTTRTGTGKGKKNGGKKAGGKKKMGPKAQLMRARKRARMAKLKAENAAANP